MKFYLAIKYHPNNQNKEFIETLCSILADLGFHSTVVARDIEKWGTRKLGPQELMEYTFHAIDKCDVVLVEFSEKGVGLGIEAGYAFAKGKPIIVIAKTGSEISTTLRGIASEVIFYNHLDELTESLQLLKE